MPESYKLIAHKASDDPLRIRRRVVITGAAGSIGAYLAKHSHETYDLLLMVRDGEDVSEIEGYGQVVQAELGEMDRLREVFSGADTIVHLAASSKANHPWSQLLSNNIIGTYNAMVAAKDTACRRFIYASSIHAVAGYPPEVQVKTDDPVNPTDLYGVSKCFGEALGRFMAEQEGLSVIAIRIGAVKSVEWATKNWSARYLSVYISERDLTNLIHCCIENETIQFAILHGLSNNRFKRLDISDSRELVGYIPQDDIAASHPDLMKINLEQLKFGNR